LNENNGLARKSVWLSKLARMANPPSGRPLVQLNCKGAMKERGKSPRIELDEIGYNFIRRLKHSLSSPESFS
jgi:hypothetical protein